MMLHNESDRVKREVLVHVARALFARDLASLDRIPLAMRPRNQRFSRCCIHKDRAALRSRVMAKPPRRASWPETRIVVAPRLDTAWANPRGRGQPSGRMAR